MAKSSEAPSGLALCWQNLEHLRLCTRAVSVFKVVFPAFAEVALLDAMQGYLLLPNEVVLGASMSSCSDAS